jgi:hypothetical protein
MRKLTLRVALMLGACGPSVNNSDSDDADTDTDADADGDPADGDPADGGDGGDTCRAPQMMILLDRTGTMHRDLTGATPPDTAPGHATAKFTLAINALEGFLGETGIDQTLRLGLAMFPRDPGGDTCITLSERLSGSKVFMNPACEVGEVPIVPELGTAAQISTLLDPETTRLCNTTPTGSGLETAQDSLDAIKTADVEQYIVLVTDGADFYDSCPTPDPIEVLKTLATAGIKTFIVGFGAQETTPQGVNPPLLNRMACAGQTAKDFDTACMPVAGGYDAVDPNGALLYQDAADGPALAAGLREVAQQVCCGCVL